MVTKDLLECPAVTVNPRDAAVPLALGRAQLYKGIAVFVGDGPVAGRQDFRVDHVYYLLEGVFFHAAASCSHVCPVAEFSGFAG